MKRYFISLSKCLQHFITAFLRKADEKGCQFEGLVVNELRNVFVVDGGGIFRVVEEFEFRLDVLKAVRKTSQGTSFHLLRKQ